MSLLTTENEAADGRDEAGKKRIEGKSANQHTISELKNSSEKNVDEVGIDELELLWRVVLVLVVELAED